MSDKIFCGSAKIVPTKFGDLTKISFSQKDIDTLQANMVNGWINLVVKEKQNKQDGKPTHYLEVDQWKPNPSNNTGMKSEDIKHQANIQDAGDNLPF